MCVCVCVCVCVCIPKIGQHHHRTYTTTVILTKGNRFRLMCIVVSLISKVLYFVARGLQAAAAACGGVLGVEVGKERKVK